MIATKIATVIYFASIFFNCAQAQSVSQFDWLIGTWTRTNVKEGRTAHERWLKNNEQELAGWGVAMRGRDTTFVEKLKLTLRDGQFYYVADVAENPNPVEFKIVSVKEHEFVCENPNHDFPKRIWYQLRNDTLHATTSGDTRAVHFYFVRKE